MITRKNSTSRIFSRSGEQSGGLLDFSTTIPTVPTFLGVDGH